jgi:hypothetical protein
LFIQTPHLQICFHCSQSRVKSDDKAAIWDVSSYFIADMAVRAHPMVRWRRWWRWMGRTRWWDVCPGVILVLPNCDTVLNTELLLFHSLIMSPNNESNMDPFAWTNTSVLCAVAVCGWVDCFWPKPLWAKPLDSKLARQISLTSAQ